MFVFVARELGYVVNIGSKEEGREKEERKI